jgi:hypothetical protein
VINTVFLLRSRTYYWLASIFAILFAIAIFIIQIVFFIAACEGNYESHGCVVHKRSCLVDTHSVSFFLFLAFSHWFSALNFLHIVYFRRFREIVKRNCCLRHVSLSICQNGTTRLTPNGSSWNSVWLFFENMSIKFNSWQQ